MRVLLDGSDLRKPHSTALECLSTVRALDGDLIAGYPTLNAVGVGRDGQQALLYHHTYSPLESGFKSEGDKVKHAIETVTRALRQVGVGRYGYSTGVSMMLKSSPDCSRVTLALSSVLSTTARCVLPPVAKSSSSLRPFNHSLLSVRSRCCDLFSKKANAKSDLSLP